MACRLSGVSGVLGATQVERRGAGLAAGTRGRLHVRDERATRLAGWLGIVSVCLAFAIYGFITAWLAPISARLHYDPSLQYMLSSLSWFRGATYAYIDHPGTPLEVLGTVLLALTLPFVNSAPGGFITFHLTHPQVFLGVAQTLLVVASMAVAAWLTRHSIAATHWTAAVASVAVAAQFFVLHPTAFDSLAVWSH